MVVTFEVLKGTLPERLIDQRLTIDAKGKNVKVTDSAAVAPSIAKCLWSGDHTTATLAIGLLHPTQERRAATLQKKV